MVGKIIIVFIAFFAGVFYQSYETEKVKNDFAEYVHRGLENKGVDGTVFTRTCHLPTWKTVNPNADIIRATSTGTQEHFIIHWKEK